MKLTPVLNWYNTTGGQYAQIFRVSPILLDTNEFSGQISDFNFWSRTLTNQEIDQFSSGCQYDFETISKPDLLKWSKVNITYSSTKNYYGKPLVKKSDFCLTQQQNLIDFVPMTEVSYDDAFQACSMLNGKMPLLQNGSALLEETHLKNILKIENDTCQNGYWLPIVKSKSNSTKWILDVRDGSPETEFNVVSGSGSRIKLDGKGSCLILKSNLEEFSSTFCTNTYCSLCQMDQKRILFSLKGICDVKVSISSTFYKQLFFVKVLLHLCCVFLAKKAAH